MTLNYLIYFVVFIILTFVIIITFKSLKKVSKFGQQKIKSLYEENKFKELDRKEDNTKLSNEIEELKKLYNEGVLTDEEFNKAKEKF